MISNGELLAAIDEAVTDFDVAETAYAQCMRAEGFDYEVRRVSVELDEPGAGLMTLQERRRRWGYGIASSEGSNGMTATVTGGQVPPEQMEAAGVASDTGGACGAFSSIPDVLDGIVQLQNEFAELPPEAESNPLVLDAMDKWSDCMKVRGYYFATPTDASRKLNNEYESITEPSEQLAFRSKELRVAGADVECSETTILPVLRKLLVLDS